MPRCVFSLCAACAAVIAFQAAAAHDQWPEFRGPTGQGHSHATGLPVEWSTRKNVAWKQPVPGEGWSSPVVADGKVFLTTAVAEESPNADTGDSARVARSLRALCYDAATGKPLWNVEVFPQPADAPRIHKKNSHASPTPIIEGQRLYVHFGHQGTACLSTSGKNLWRNRDLSYRPVHGNGGSPILVGDALIFSADGGREPFIAALDKTTGKLLWKTLRRTDAAKRFSFHTPLAVTIDGQTQVLTQGSNVLDALDPATGRRLWWFRYEGYSVIPRPVFGNGIVYLGAGYDRPSLLAVRAGGVGDVTDKALVWKARQGAPHTPSPVLAGDEIYAVSDRGIVTCFDAATGRVHWRERLRGNFSASPVLAEGRLYLQSEEGTGYVLAAGKTFKKLAENPLSERTLASYAVVDEAIFIRSAGHLYRIEDKSSN